jgi:uncharacterized protein
MTKKELRYLPAKELRIQPNPDGSKTLSGYAIVFNSRSNNLGNFVEVVNPSAVVDTLRDNKDVLLLRDHDPKILLGRTSSGTLKINTDNTGVFFRCVLPDTSQANDVATLVERRDLQGCSFSFNCLDDAWAKDASGQLIRTLKKINISELSIVSIPAYPDTAVSIRSCPPEFRSMLDSTLDDDEDECECDCDACEAGDHCFGDDCDFDDEDRSIVVTKSERHRMHMRLTLALHK